MARIGMIGRRLRRPALVLACGYPAALLALGLLQRVAPQRSGILALTQVFAPYLFLPLALLAPLLFLRNALPFRLLAAACCLLFGVQFAPRASWSTPHADPAATTLDIITWNVHFERVSLERVRRFIETKPADVIALQEDYLVWYDQDHAIRRRREEQLARVYPHQVRFNRAGLVILSAYPIVEEGEGDAHPPRPDALPLAWGRLDLGRGRTVVVATAHPANAAATACRDTPWSCYDATRRDAQVRQIRAAIEPFLQRDEPLLLMGDFNLTERDPAYRELTVGLQDAHGVVGAGVGHTWGPDALMRHRMPLLRLDYVLSSPRVTPFQLGVDCTPRGSDHCLLRGRVAVR